eukprot:TRINITY_DN1003_c0_g1_i5.p1 TRINITY_DN1003_c0_g1~~TRINITY_DN1003_c0_g1_i5.p1  ORF type:complete len:532 (-),score=75.95 TRINITY_DN1003_c0_g1_i5:58-1653(-)
MAEACSMLPWQELTTSSLSEQYAQNWVALKMQTAEEVSEKAGSSCGTQEPGSDGAGTGGTVLEAGSSETASTPPSDYREPRPQPLQLADWSVDHVNQWLDCSPLPDEVISVLKNHAINGPVLETLTEGDLLGIGIEKFGWRRQMLISRKELIDLLDARRRPPDCAEVFEMSSARSRENSSEPGPSLARDIAETETVPCTPRVSSRSVVDRASSFTRRAVAGPSKQQNPISGAGALPPAVSFAPSPSRSTAVRTMVRPPRSPTLVEPCQAKGARWRSPIMPRTDSYFAVPCSSLRPVVVRASSLSRARSPSCVSPKLGSRSVNVASPCPSWPMIRDFRMPVTQGPQAAVAHPATSPPAPPPALPLHQCCLSPTAQPVLHAVPVASPVQAAGRAVPPVPASLLRSAVSLYALPAATAAGITGSAVSAPPATIGAAAPAPGPRAQARHVQSPRHVRPTTNTGGNWLTGSPAAAMQHTAHTAPVLVAHPVTQAPQWAFVPQQAHQAAAHSLTAQEGGGHLEAPSTMPMSQSRPLL